MEIEVLKKLRDSLTEELEKDIRQMEKQSGELSRFFLLSTYKNLSQLDQYTGGIIVDVTKVNP